MIFLKAKLFPINKENQRKSLKDFYSMILKLRSGTGNIQKQKFFDRKNIYL